MGVRTWFHSTAAPRGGGRLPPRCRSWSRASEPPALGAGGCQRDGDAGLRGSPSACRGWVLPLRAPMLSLLPGRALAPASLDAPREPGSGRTPLSIQTGQRCAMAPGTGTGHGRAEPPRSQGLGWGAGGAGQPPATVAPGPAAQPAASCAGAHCSAAPGCGAGFLCQSSAIFYSNN